MKKQSKNLPVQLLLLLVILGVSFSGCSTGLFPAPSQNPVATNTLTPDATGIVATQAMTPTGSIAPVQPQKLVVWLPPQFDPAANTPASILMKDRLQAFSLAHDNIPIEVRVKAASGAGGLLEALSTANSAAPLALPDLIALPRGDLEVAALKGLLAPYDGNTSAPDDADWYAYARQMALLQGSTFGLPFAGDALVMLYRPAQIKTPPANWDALLSQGGVLAFPAADPQALATLALYLSAGGTVEDQQHRPILAADALTSVFKVYEKGVRNQNISLGLAQYQTDGQAWQAFKEQRAAWVITWVSNYLAELPADTSMIPLLPVGEKTLTVASGWVWALAKPKAESHQLSIELAEWLVKGDFLATWTAAAGFLPPRPTALAGWPNQSLQSLLSQVVLTAQLRPANDLMISLGAALRDATLQVLKGQSDAVQAAQSAVEHIQGQ